MSELKEVFENKKVLFIRPEYFGYENAIAQLMRDAGAAVFEITENLDATSFFYGALNKMPASVRKDFVKRRFLKEIEKIDSKDVDYVFCIRISQFDDEILKALKTKFHNAKFLLYYWDSCKNLLRGEENARYFDKVATFDRGDYIKNIENGWCFRPLFYIPEFEPKGENLNRTIDVLFIATLSRERAKWYTLLKKYCDDNGLNFYAKLYVKDYIYRLQKNRFDEYKNLPEEVITTVSIPMEEIIKKMQHSRIMFDVSHGTQSGLTMRTIECLGAKEKMASNNQGLREYDFYNEKNIFLYNDESFDGLKEFVEAGDFEMIDENIYKSYSLEEWLLDIFR